MLGSRGVRHAQQLVHARWLSSSSQQGRGGVLSGSGGPLPPRIKTLRPRAGRARLPSAAPAAAFSTADDSNSGGMGDMAADPLNRWAVVLPACIVEMSMGSIYCAAMWSAPLTTLSGVVASAPNDFSVSQVVPLLSAAAVGLAVASSTLGKRIEAWGPVKAGTIGSACWFTGLMTCAAASELQSLPLLYTGYGAFGGTAWALLYLSPVSTTMKWFPDRRGLATGITLSAFGAGMAIAPPLIDFFTSYFFVAPDFLGLASEVALMTLVDGTQVLASDGATQVIVATATDAQKVGLTEGVYTVNTGNSGASGAFAALACVYGGIGATASQFMRAPPTGWVPQGFTADPTSTAGTTAGINSSVVLRDASFPLLWVTVFGNAVGGLALISASKMVMTDIWSTALPTIVTASFATAYVTSLGLANSFGRLTWAIASDKLGRRNTYSVFALGIPIMAGTPFLIATAMEGAGAATVPLAMFVGGSVFCIVNYGGIFSVLPAYIADLYGQKHSTSIHGMALTAWAASATAGPMGLAALRGHEQSKAIDNLAATVDPAKFEAAFGMSLEYKQSLIDSKTLTISRLMEIVPPGTVDPTPYLYNSTFYTAAGFIGLAAVCNQLLKAPNLQAVLKREAEQKAKADHQA